MVLDILHYNDMRCLPPLRRWELLRLQKELNILEINYQEIEGLSIAVGAHIPPRFGDSTLLIQLWKEDGLITYHVYASLRYGYMFWVDEDGGVNNLHPSKVLDFTIKAFECFEVQLEDHRQWACETARLRRRDDQAMHAYKDRFSLLVTTCVPGCKCVCNCRNTEVISASATSGATFASNSTEQSSAGGGALSAEGEAHTFMLPSIEDDAVWGVSLRFNHIWCLICKRQPSSEMVPSITIAAALKAEQCLEKQYNLKAS